VVIKEGTLGIRIKMTSLMVDDQDKGLAFYTEVLGFRKKHDIPVGDNLRWITVVSAEGPNDLELALEPNQNPAGRAFQEAMLAQGIPVAAFEVGDLAAEYERLTARGAAFVRKPTLAGPISVAVLVDTCGNLIQLYQVN
jgi:glyoxylase I family protein